MFSRRRILGLKILRGAAGGLRDSFKISAAIIAAAVVIIWAVSPQLMYLLVGNEKEVIRIGVQYLHIISLTFPFVRQPLFIDELPTRGRGDWIFAF